MRNASGHEVPGPARLAASLLLVTLVTACSGGADEVVCAREPTEIDEGLEVQDGTCGEGEPAGRGDLLSVKYEGSIDGKVFERTSDPFRFRLGMGEVIEGWDEGMRGMQEGGVRTLTIPPELGYGSTGLEPDIPPGATLTYEIELISRQTPD
jgi:FKBP-type peptidyl-prolyl cis-trans isomerase